jgi:hypothetical protein
MEGKEFRYMIGGKEIEKRIPVDGKQGLITS